MKAAKNIGSGRTESASPTVIIYNGDESKLEYDGLTLSADGSLAQSGLKVNEAYAMENEVWILGISETANGCDGNLSRCEGVGGTNGTNGTYTDNYVIPKIKVKRHKEYWASGASEVHMLVYMNNINLSASNPRFVPKHEIWYGNFEGNRIKKGRRKDIRKENSLTVNFDFVKQWEATYINKDYAYYILFEYDPWPAGKRNARWLSNLNIKYRSQDSWYAKDVVFRSSAEYYSVNNSSIEFSID